MKKTTTLANKGQAPTGVALRRLVRPRNPWQQWDDRRAKLKAARALAARRRELKWHKEDELSRLRSQDKTRIKYGIPLELPKMKPWDHKMGRVA